MIDQEVVTSAVLNTLLLNSLLGFVALTMLFLILRWFDWLSGGKFSEMVVPLLRKDPMAAAIYYGSRILAVAILLAPIYGAVRF